MNRSFGRLLRSASNSWKNCWPGMMETDSFGKFHSLEHSSIRKEIEGRTYSEGQVVIPDEEIVLLMFPSAHSEGISQLVTGECFSLLQSKQIIKLLLPCSRHKTKIKRLNLPTTNKDGQQWLKFFTKSLIWRHCKLVTKLKIHIYIVSNETFCIIFNHCSPIFLPKNNQL